MHHTRRHILAAGGAALLAPNLASRVRAADNYPNKPIKVIVASAAGGPTDLPARIASQILQAKFGHAAVVENRPGAGGAIGARAVASSLPDGYTLLMGNTSTLAVIPAVRPARATIQSRISCR
jgi:tripartite-type tricarboxylate transporter receptor subunit TctC